MGKTSKPRGRKSLFDPVIAPVAHVAYDRFRSETFLEGARLLMDHLFDRMGDADSNFIADFQGPGFHSRVFELACFAYFEETGWTIERGRPHPDFLLTKDGVEVAVEAVTSNPTNGRDVDIALSQVADPRTVDILAKCTDELPIRMGGVLREKMKKKYWTRGKAAGRPFVLIVAPFHEAGSTTYVDEQLGRYLFGIDRFTDWVERRGVLVREDRIESHSFNGKTIPSNFFEKGEDAESLSAVIWCNQFTLSRFQRIWSEGMGLPDELGAIMVRGSYAVDGNPPTAPFEYEVGDGRAPPEIWSRGVTLFINPHARVPLPPNVIEASSTFRMAGGRLVREIEDFHPLLAVTSWHPRR